jgi:glycosyltransferase involved in cell wall biosynthesis
MSIGSAEKKLLHIIPSLPVGGAEILLLSILKGMKARNLPVNIRILTLIEKGPLAPEFEKIGIVVDSLNIPPDKSTKSLIGTFRYLKRYRPHIVHTHLWHADKFGQLVSFLLRVPHRISTIHNFEANITFKELVWNWLWSRMATGMISVSETSKHLWVVRRGYPAGKIQVIYNATEFDPPEGVRTREKCSPGVRLLSLGRINEQKGVLYTIMAFEDLLNDYPGATLDIYGPSYIEDYRNMLDEYISENDLAGAVTFKGATPDPMSVYPRYDILLLSSLWEGFHIVTVEGMSCGIPIVATNIDVHAEIFRDGEFALLVPPKKPADMAAAVLRLIREPSLYGGLSARGLMRCKDFDREKMLVAYHDYYMRIID